ncbi:hypothetical protein GPROT1_04048 [Gammaproteobacteria bacterium]|nr:hypothetical protein GPROT1_04048 [Gammaproteobacteria bacterium]
MLLKPISLVCVWVFTLLIAVGCSNLTPTFTPAPTILSVVATRASSTPTPPNVVKFGTLSNSGGSVTMDAQLLDFQINQPLVIEIAMNTHSVELADEMTKVSILRDDSGNEYKPTAWEGAGPGGHHREGKLKFAAMTTQPKYIELVIKDLAKVAERSFRWELR